MIHLIDVKETLKGLLLAKRLIAQNVASGKDVVFVGTKRQAKHAVEEESRRCGMHYVTERWLGGTLTNFRTIRARLNRLEELEKLFTTGQIDTYSKKMKSALQREMDKIKSNLEGIRKMERVPGLMVIIDTRREHIAVKEAKKLGVKTIALIDTDSDPDLIDLPIPGNDDAMRAIEIVMHELAEAVIEGKSGRTDAGKPTDEQAQQPRRRSTRAAFRAEDGREDGGREDGGREDGGREEAPAGEPAPQEATPAAEPVAAGQG